MPMAFSILFPAICQRVLAAGIDLLHNLTSLDCEDNGLGNNKNITSTWQMSLHSWLLDLLPQTAKTHTTLK